jgi:hypothetical protein
VTNPTSLATGQFAATHCAYPVCLNIEFVNKGRFADLRINGLLLRAGSRSEEIIVADIYAPEWLQRNYAARGYVLVRGVVLPKRLDTAEPLTGSIHYRCELACRKKVVPVMAWMN